MTNNEIIAAAVLETVGSDAVAALAATIYTPRPAGRPPCIYPG